MGIGALAGRHSRAIQAPIWLLPIAALFIIWWIGAARYVGYGGDDYQYLVAAKCVAERFWCVPLDHWARRAPIVLPVAGSIRVFGLNQMALWLAPAFYAMAAVGLFSALLQRIFGFWPAFAGALTLILTPAFLELTPGLGIDVAEFAFLMLSAFALERIWATGERRWSVVFGIAVGLAVMSRPTALAALPIFAVAFWRLRLGWRAAVAAFLAVLAVEAGIYLYLTGDPLLTWKLSLRHTSLHSSELSGVDISRSPILNIDIIRAWPPSAGIDAHWTVKGLVNLAANNGLFPLFYWTVALGFVAGVKRRISGRGAKLILWLVFAAMSYFGMLTYVLAIDPQPRLFLPWIAVLCAIFGICAVALFDDGFRLLSIVAIGSIIFRGVTVSYDRYDMAPVNRRAMEIEETEGKKLPIHPVTARGMALIPDAASLPVFSGTSSRFLIIGLGGCTEVRGWSGFMRWKVEREIQAPRDVPRIITWLRGRRLFVDRVFHPTLCILSKAPGA